jgi:hypothetical protein
MGIEVIGLLPEEKRNKFLKWFVIGSIVFLVVFNVMMIIMYGWPF